MQSPGHRANILAPEHTQVGIGVAYNAASGDVSITQEFVNHYAQTMALPRRTQVGERVVLRGQLTSGSQEPLVNIAYEPFPESLTLDQLNATGTYTSRAETVAVVPVSVGSAGDFVSEFRLDTPGHVGLYHVRLWVKRDGAEQVPAVDAIIEVR
jgi:hypothetical protein